MVRDAVTVGIGAGVAEERKVLGLTQRQLAERAHISLSLLRKVEQGSVSPSPALTSALARAQLAFATLLQARRTAPQSADPIPPLT